MISLPGMKKNNMAAKYTLLRFNSFLTSCHSKNNNKKFSDSHVTDDVITLDVTWEDILWQMLTCCGLSVFYV